MKFKFFATIIIVLCHSSLAIGTDMKTDRSGFIRDWLIGGAYPNYWFDGKPQGFHHDFLAKFGGELNIDPHSNMKDEVVFKADTGKLIAGIGAVNEWGWKEDKTMSVSWRKLHWSKDKPLILLDRMFLPVDDHIVSYGSCYIYVPAAVKVKFCVGSDDDNKLYLNGKLIGSANSAQGIVPDNFIYQGELKRGLNHVLLKVIDRAGGYGFCVSICDMAKKPLAGLKIFVEHPKWNLIQSVSGIKSIDDWSEGYYAGFNFETKEFFNGKHNMSLQFGAPKAGTFALYLTASLNGKAFFKKTLNTCVEEGKLFDWPLDIDFPPGMVDLCLSVKDTNGKELAILEKTVNVYDQGKIQSDIKKMRLQLAKNSDIDIAAIRLKLAQGQKRLDELQGERSKLYAQIEDSYAARRAKFKSNPMSVDEPLTPASTARMRICLNGDNWQVIAAKDDTIPHDSMDWTKCKVPEISYDAYFRTGRFPVILANKKNPRGVVTPLSGWKDFRLNPAQCADSPLWFKLNFSIEPGQESHQYSFISDCVAGRLKVFLNGEYCGDYWGDIGIVEISLKNVKAGENQLVLRVEPERKTFLHLARGWGLKDSVYIERTALVRVSSVNVKTSWRNAKLLVDTEVQNRSTVPVKIQLKQYCVLNDHIKYRLEPAEHEISPGASVSLKNSGVWTEAKLWGIGGDYGEPTLYQLVSDLYVDGKLVDRRMDRFGFREFWIAGTDFYLNGKHIVLQGDVGSGRLEIRHVNDIFFPLLRTDGINIVRSHDNAYYSPELLRSCDEYGMLVYAQMYPVLHDGPVTPDMKKPGSKTLIPYEAWFTHPLHQYNLDNYARGVKMLRNHPSVVIISTDNEIFTQSWDTLSQEEFNVRNDRIGAFYEKYVKSLASEYVLTRNGDVGTWGVGMGKWHEDPPCETANYHYPDYNIDNYVKNWQVLYDFRPVIFGETLYCSYFDWTTRSWVGPRPELVAKKAVKIREVAGIYRKLGIPCAVYMGLGADGFAKYDDTGKGNPWGITSAMHEAYLSKDAKPGIAPYYPWARIEWPSLSGLGYKPVAANINIAYNGSVMVNWFDPAAPSHVRNEVNDAYRDTLIRQPSLARGSGAECIIEAGADLKGEIVIARSEDGIYEPVAVIADAKGKAWFRLPRPGKYLIECKNIKMRIEVPSRTSYAEKPGFDMIPHYKFH